VTDLRIHVDPVDAVHLVFDGIFDDLEANVLRGGSNVDGDEPLLAEIFGDGLFVVAGETAIADLAVGGDCAEEEGGGHYCRRVSRRGAEYAEKRYGLVLLCGLP